MEINTFTQQAKDDKQAQTIVRDSLLNSSPITDCCEVCIKLSQALKEDAEKTDPVRLGTLNEIETRSLVCRVCCEFADFIRSRLQDTNMPWENYSEPYYFYHNQSKDPEHRDLYILSDRKSGFQFIPFSLDRGSQAQSWIDEQWIRSWLDHCDAHHSLELCARTMYRSRKLSQIRVIDVIQKCLVIVTQPAKYLTLSYVWGSKPDSLQRTTTHNLRRLEQPGQLNFEDANSGIPRTISDALQLVSNLGERYLWVDRYCIIQDDPLDKTLYINSMDEVFYGSYCNVVAASGQDMHYGIEGIRHGSQPRNFSEYVIHLPNLPLLAYRDANSLSYEKSTWFKRRWTFQEMILSRRSLYFHNRTMQWACQSSQSQDNTLSRTVGISELSSHTLRLPSLRNSFPDLHLWSRKLYDYVSRESTYDVDFLIGFAGIESLLHNTFPGGFLKGLPQYFLDAALLWQPHHRIKRIRNSDVSSDSEGYLPSWSWCGWASVPPRIYRDTFDLSEMIEFGTVEIRSNFNCPADRRSGLDHRSLVDWYIVDHVGNRRPARADHRAWRHLRDPERFRLWSKAQGDSESGDWAMHEEHEEHRGPYFTHPMAQNCTFWWPILIGANYAEGADTNTTVDYIECHTIRAHLEMDQTYSELGTKDSFSAWIRDRNGYKIGLVTLHDELDHEATVAAEFIAISQGSAMDPSNWGQEIIPATSHIFEEWAGILDGGVENEDEKEESKDEGMESQAEDTGGESKLTGLPLYEFYNVMWIERVGEFCCRKGIGRVHKPAWDRLAFEKTTVKLR